LRKPHKATLSIVLALAAVVAITVSAAAASTYRDRITGSELPNATETEGMFVGTATGGLPGGWFIDVRHQVLDPYHSAYITGGYFELSTVLGNRPHLIRGAFAPYGGNVTQLSGFNGCVNQRFAVHGALVDVHTTGLSGHGVFDAILTHYQTWIWRSCVIFAATVVGTVSLTL
jgi:hypothetical protein